MVPSLFAHTLQKIKATYFARPEVFIAVTIQVVVFWIMMSPHVVMW
jgi:hypothetical protein